MSIDVESLDLEALDRLMTSPLRLDDMTALDLLYACWPRHTAQSRDERLLLVAQNLAVQFGMPDHVPLACAAAWRMLSPQTFSYECAAQLRDITHFINEWQETRTEFLILEFGEMDLIECLFETLDIGTNADLLGNVMTFKVLSMRRAGLLRRIPPRVERQFAPLIEQGRADLAVAELAKVRDFLARFANPEGFAPIVEAARFALARIEKDMEVLKGAADAAMVAIE